MTTGAYIGCGTTVNILTSVPAILFRQQSGSVWTKVHEHATANGCYSGVSGLQDGSLVVAVGGTSVRGSYAYGDAVLSYARNGVWQDVTTGLPASPHSFTCVYVVGSDEVYIGGWDGQFSAGGRGYVWRWTPSTNTFQIVLDMGKAGGNAILACCSIKGTDRLNMWASAYNSGCDCDGRIFNSTDGGVTWPFSGQAPEGGFAASSTSFIHVVDEDKVFANAISGAGTSPGYRGSTGWFDGSWSWYIRHYGSFNNNSYGAVAGDGWAVVSFWYAGGIRIGKIAGEGGILTEKLNTGSDQFRGGHLALSDEEEIVFVTYDQGFSGDANRAYFAESSDVGETWSALERLRDGSLTQYYFAEAAFIVNGIPVPSAEADPEGPYQLINNFNDYEYDTKGRLKRDKSIASRCRARLCTRKGEWIGDLAFGSRLHTIKTTENAEELALNFIIEALEPLFNAGEIVRVEPIEFILDHPLGSLGVSVEILLPNSEVIPLGIIPVGAS